MIRTYLSKAINLSNVVESLELHASWKGFARVKGCEKRRVIGCEILGK